MHSWYCASGAGTELTVVEPDGSAWRARVVEVLPDRLTAERLEQVPGAPPCRVTLVQGVAKGTKVDLVVEKATELNIEAVVPVLTERSVVRFDDEKRRTRGERWRRVGGSREAVPAHLGSRGERSGALLRVLPRLAGADAVLVVWEGAAATGPGIGQALDEAGVDARSKVALVVGPEGGLTAGEVYALEAAGARAVTLGETVLRSETAGIVAAALCVYELGGLGGRPRE
jgi:16S rRNA (uracil1498-N3)-methyltransferase